MRLASNVTANLVATAVSVGSAVAAVPILVRHLGLDDYGLVGFHATLAAVLSAFDLGLTPSVNRECARRSAQHASLGNFLATTAAISWLIALALGLGVAALSPWMAQTWLGQDTQPGIIVLMGLAIAAQWPASCYRAGLNGLQHQVLASTIGASSALARSLGIALLLLATGGTVVEYFVVQICIGLFETFVTRSALRAKLSPEDRRGVPQRAALTGTMGFTAGMALAGALGLVLTQTDRIVVSRVVPLASFALYAIAGALAAGVFRAAQAVLGAAVPRFSELAATHDNQTLAKNFRTVAQTVACVVLPIGFTIAFLPVAALRGWGQPIDVVEGAAPLTAALVAGASIHCLVHAPYALLLAFGAARFAVLFNAIAIVILVPTVYLAAQLYGAEGAAFGWLLLDALMFAGPVIVLVAHYLPGHAARWLAADVFVPVVVAASVPLTMNILAGPPTSRSSALAQLGAAWLFAFVLTAMTTRVGRRRLSFLLDRVKRVQSRLSGS
ncbi:MAG: oligosaccharide flippase family protein [Phycisphaerae bacterium]|nr:oligosaccharide flippase family protein [Phycisphaerae bacterium]